MKRKNVLIVGCGQLGISVGSHLATKGYAITGVRRRGNCLPSPFEHVAADYSQPGALNFAAQMQPEIVITTFTPTGRSDEGYQRGFSAGMSNLLKGLGDHRPELLLMVSSTRVFAESDGGWVDESSPLDADDARSQAIIAAESQLLGSEHTASVVRFGGIYGNPGGMLLSRIRSGSISPPLPVRYGNRIHREDCVGILAHLAHRAVSKKPLSPVYIGVDDAPAPRHDVEAWLAKRMGIDVVFNADSGLRSSHRRCRNDRIKESGYELVFPDYRSGYAAVLAQGDSTVDNR